MTLHPTIPPIAMLHCVSDQISDDTLRNWCISPKAFLRLLDHLESNHYNTTHFAEIEQGTGKLQRKKVVLSFDDCLKHLFDFAIPQLVQRKMKAVFYMPSAHIGGYNSWDVEKRATRLEVMNESDLKELVRLGFEVGSHSHHHIELKDLPEDQIKEEAVLSKSIIESITNKTVYSFSYPYGAVPPAYQQILKVAGYKYGVSIYQPFETELALRRFGVYEKDDANSLNRKLSRSYKWFRKVYDVVKKY